MNTLKKWGLYGSLILLLLSLSGCGQVSGLTTGTDEAYTTTTLSNISNTWHLDNGTSASLHYTNNTEEPVTLTFISTPLSVSLSYVLPGDTQRYSQDFGILSSLATYTIDSGQTQTWVIDRLPDGATDVVLTLNLFSEDRVITQAIPLD